MVDVTRRLEPLLPAVARFWDEAVAIWAAGGWAMYAIAAIALVMFSFGVHIHFALRAKGIQSVPEETWRHWIDHPLEREGPLGRMLDLVTGGRSLGDSRFFFEQLRTTEVVPFERDLRVMRICVSAAPLVGLLGTVTGMLSTFAALASGSGGEKTMALVAAGISEALITTETGLVVALPGLFLQYQLTRRYERYRAFIAHLEVVCTQVQYREQGAERRRQNRRLAVASIARHLRDGLAARMNRA